MLRSYLKKIILLKLNIYFFVLCFLFTFSINNRLHKKVLINPFIQPSNEVLYNNLKSNDDLNSNNANENNTKITNNNSEILPFYMMFAKLAYCPGRTIKRISCTFCNNFKGYSTFVSHSNKYQSGKRILFAILINDEKSEVVVTFSGPKSKHLGDLYSEIYSKGFVYVKELDNIRIESTYWSIYSSLMRPVLEKSIRSLQLYKRFNYKIKFIGHSFGGSLAVLAAYDLKRRGVLEHVPEVFTYGQLRIGDMNFVNMVNQHLQIIKVLKDDDYITRSPNCYFSQGKYICDSNFNYIFNKIPTLKDYYNNYFYNVDPLINSNSQLFIKPYFGPEVPQVRKLIPAIESPSINNNQIKRIVEAEDVNEKPLIDNNSILLNSNNAHNNINENNNNLNINNDKKELKFNAKENKDNSNNNKENSNNNKENIKEDLNVKTNLIPEENKNKDNNINTQVKDAKDNKSENTFQQKSEDNKVKEFNNVNNNKVAQHSINEILNKENNNNNNNNNQNNVHKTEISTDKTNTKKNNQNSDIAKNLLNSKQDEQKKIIQANNKTRKSEEIEENSNNDSKKDNNENINLNNKNEDVDDDDDENNDDKHNETANSKSNKKNDSNKSVKLIEKGKNLSSFITLKTKFFKKCEIKNNGSRINKQINIINGKIVKSITRHNVLPTLTNFVNKPQAINLAPNKLNTVHLSIPNNNHNTDNFENSSNNFFIKLEQKYKSPIIVPRLSSMYSQPFGIQYMVSSSNNQISYCNYIKGVPVCELNQGVKSNVIELENHRLYFNNNIEECNDRSKIK